MGTDKATIVVDPETGETLVARAQRVLAEANVRDVVVAGHHGVPDPSSEALGPMAGIVSGWAYLKSTAGVAKAFDPILVLSCDLPALTSDVITTLLEASQGKHSGAIAHDGQRIQPLIAAYRPPALDDMTDAFARGERSVRRCFDQWDLAVVHFDAAVLADADTPEDLRGFGIEIS